MTQVEQVGALVGDSHRRIHDVWRACVCHSRLQPHTGGFLRLSGYYSAVYTWSSLSDASPGFWSCAFGQYHLELLAVYADATGLNSIVKGGTAARILLLAHPMQQNA